MEFFLRKFRYNGKFSTKTPNLHNSQMRSAIFTQKFGIFYILCLKVPSADDPDQARQNVRPDLDPNCLTR